VEAALMLRLRKRCEAVVEDLSSSAGPSGLSLLSEMLEQFEGERFRSPQLQALAAAVRWQDNSNGRTRSASSAVRELARLTEWTDARHGLIVQMLELPLLYTCHLAYAAQAWRKRHGQRMRVWVDIVGQIEALLSLAAYSFEHPGDPFPEILEQRDFGPTFDAQDLGHPLIPAKVCVRNSLSMGHPTRLLMVSGSNMAGKSTLLRTVGLNLVLALAGGPVRAKVLRTTSFTIGTCIRTVDSLQEGRSGFYTEALRLRLVFDLLGGPLPLLFLFDELLDGTNSKDRRVGAEGLLKALMAENAVGIVTTHDLALTELMSVLGNCARNVHFQDHVEAGQMRFDYRLHDGVVAKSNAIELLRLIGLRV
jgi:DNA mismatch repair ATPase MutS